MFRSCLKGYKKWIGPEAVDTLETARYLGLACETQGKSKDAESMIRREFEGFGKIIGPFYTPTHGN
jgi:hypothetical protein